MSLEGPHAKYSDIVMLAAAYKGLKKAGFKTKGKAPTRKQVKAAKKACYDYTRKLDITKRSSWPRYNSSWSTSTASNITGKIRRHSEKAIKTEIKKLTGRLVSEVDVDSIVTTASLAFIPAAAAVNETVEISRRGLLLGAGATAFAAVTFGGTSQAMAEDWEYIKQIDGAAKGYAGGKSRAVVRSVGAGIRAELDRKSVV